MHKLFNFPSVNVITIPECLDRIHTLKSQFDEYGVRNINVNTLKRYEPETYLFEGEYVHLLADSHKGVLTSHLISIKKWLQNSTEEYSIFCEDDLSLETVKYWSFDWCTFLSSLPKNWGCVQLVLVKDHNMKNYDLCFRQRNWDDWSTCCFMIKRSFAKKLIDFYYKENIFTLNYRGLDEYKRKTIENNYYWIIPSNENILYSLIEPTYVVPLFVENINFSSSSNLFLDNSNKIHQALGHVESYNETIKWWKSGGLNLNDVKNYPEVFG